MKPTNCTTRARRLTKYFQFKETNSADVIPGITTATIDASE